MSTIIPFVRPRQGSRAAGIDSRRIECEGQHVRMGLRPGTRPDRPVLFVNGIGANLELAAPLLRAWPEPDIILFDAPGTGASPRPVLPMTMPGIARLAMAVASAAGCEEVDVLGLSWGGGVAQEIARQYPDRCRRLVLAATSAGACMIPGSPAALAMLLDPHGILRPGRTRDYATALYGSNLDGRRPWLEEQAGAVISLDQIGYLFQIVAGITWSSLPWLWQLRQPTLVLSGRDDLIVPAVNGRLLAALIPRARFHALPGGHLCLYAHADEAAALLRDFLATSHGSHQ